jgi:hypothetical protein
MPFTISHPAIVLPLYKKQRTWVNLTGLVLGAMSPDFEYFLRLKPFGTVGHTWWGVFVMNVPIAILLAYIFHYMVKLPLVSNFPVSIQRYFVEIARFKWKIKGFKAWSVFILSIIIGAWSHIFWDSWTHETGYFVQMFEIFKNEVYIASFRWPVYKFLQHGSTLIGFFIIAMYVFRNRAKGDFELLNRELKCKVIYWLIFLAATVSFVCISYITGNIRGIGAVVVVLIDGAVIGCIIASGVDRIKNIM